MSNQIKHPNLINTQKPAYIAIDQITAALKRLRNELEEIAQLDKQSIPADQLLYDVCVVLDLPVVAIHQILGTDLNPYHENFAGD